MHAVVGWLLPVLILVGQRPRTSKYAPFLLKHARVRSVPHCCDAACVDELVAASGMSTA